MVKKTNIAVIPARGNSKRLKHKNKIEFHGLPLLVWTIKAALASNIFDRIIVSTDDLEIAKIASDYGVDVPFLRKKFADDFTPVSLATIEAVEESQKFYNENYENVFQLLPTCPLRDQYDILEAYSKFKSINGFFMISVVQFRVQNPWWAIKLDESFKATFLFENEIKKRSQDLDSLYVPTGAIWIANKQALFVSRTFYGNSFDVFIMAYSKSIDIDTDDDLTIAHILFDYNELSQKKYK